MSKEPFIEKLLAIDADAIPPEVRELIHALIEGRVKQMMFVAEVEDTYMVDMYAVLDSTANRFAMIGAIECIKRDYMRNQCGSRTEYLRREEDGGE